jgi:hypothetical protein
MPDPAAEGPLLGGGGDMELMGPCPCQRPSPHGDDGAGDLKREADEDEETGEGDRMQEPRFLRVVLVVVDP